MNRKPATPDDPAELRRRAEASLSGRPSAANSDPSTQRLLHELEVHQVELEMQNAELLKARDELEVALEKFTDLYDFAPVGYLSIDESGVILDANLKGASLLGVERSRLINRRLMLFVHQTGRPILEAFLQNVFLELKEQECEALLLKNGGSAFSAGFRGTSTVAAESTPKWCRVVFEDLTTRKQAEEAQRRVADLSNTNLGLNREIVRRQAVERVLKKSERNQSRLLAQSHHMQAQLRRLSHQILQAQEEERLRISRDLHDEIAQTLVGINVQLAALARESAGSPKRLQRDIALARRMVGKSVDKVHQFARQLRPPLLDDLRLIPALRSFLKGFAKRTGVRASLTAFAAVEQLDTAKRTVLFRVAQESLANVARHARASQVEVIIRELPDGVGMKIKNDGASFLVRRVLQEKSSKHLGLLGMRERLEMVGGSFDIESARGRGTTVTAKIPLRPAALAALTESVGARL